MTSKQLISKNNPWEDVGGGVSRQIMGWDNQILMVNVKLEMGAIGAGHTHFNTQTTYCVTGRFEFTIDGEKVIVESGDGLYVPPNILHGAIALEPGVLIDVFSPVREDFL
ncbi:cupin domain-containing protein [uncultured Draconibacterium sp.]|uniref:cupin domain-containing protein n=1 Tax=uncultured Draconibacterium sp. TaxID=1573823 RepID=UPI002AA80EB6|nr:cupin domain-containing protein [uncultured Draconibacterium sp.]